MLHAVSLQHFAFGDFVLKVPRAGVEPARVAPLVFETSASTDSAIWASSFRQFEIPKVSDKKVKNTCVYHGL